MKHLSPPAAGYENSDADPRLIAILAAGIGLFLLVTPLILALIYPDVLRLARVPSNLPQPPEPRLQIDPKADQERLHTAERERLSQIGWVDRDREVVRIPIGQAMNILVARGLAGWPPSR